MLIVYWFTSSLYIKLFYNKLMWSYAICALKKVLHGWLCTLILFQYQLLNKSKNLEVCDNAFSFMPNHAFYCESPR
jgi:hypothetical protein